MTIRHEEGESGGDRPELVLPSEGGEEAEFGRWAGVMCRCESEVLQRGTEDGQVQGAGAVHKFGVPLFVHNTVHWEDERGWVWSGAWVWITNRNPERVMDPSYERFKELSPFLSYGLEAKVSGIGSRRMFLC